MRRSNLLFSIALTGILVTVPYNARSATLDVCRSGCKYSTIQSAIDAATKDGDTVQVEKGDYRENIVFPNQQITVRSIDGPKFTWIQGISSNQHTVSFSPGKKHRVIQGFRVARGKLGGMRIEGNGAVIGCQVLSNEGPGIKISGGTTGIFNTTISANRARNGGGVYITKATVNIIGSTIKGNSAFDHDGGGGGIFAVGATVNLVDSTIQENQKNGISLVNSQAYIRVSKIIKNREGSSGGIEMYLSDLKIFESVISGNSGDMVGAILSRNKSKLMMINCTVANNMASGHSIGQPSETVGGIKIADSVEGYDSVITNCTVVYNHAEGAFGGGTGGIGHRGAGSVSVINSIVVKNSAVGNKEVEDREDFWSVGPGSVKLVYSCVKHVRAGNWWPTGWIQDCNHDDFVAPAQPWDYHLRSGSKCIDAGTKDKAQYPTIPKYDIDNDRRPQGASHDMGSDEFVPTI